MYLLHKFFTLPTDKCFWEELNILLLVTERTTTAIQRRKTCYGKQREHKTMKQMTRICKPSCKFLGACMHYATHNSSSPKTKQWPPSVPWKPSPQRTSGRNRFKMRSMDCSTPARDQVGSSWPVAIYFECNGNHIFSLWIICSLFSSSAFVQQNWSRNTPTQKLLSLISKNLCDADTVGKYKNHQNIIVNFQRNLGKLKAEAQGHDKPAKYKKQEIILFNMNIIWKLGNSPNLASEYKLKADEEGQTTTHLKKEFRHTSASQNLWAPGLNRSAKPLSTKNMILYLLK